MNNRRNWTHPIRYSLHRLKLELRSIPDACHIAYGSMARQQAQRINQAQNRCLSDLRDLRNSAGNPVEFDRNARWYSLSRKLRTAQFETAIRREAAALTAAPDYQRMNRTAQALALISVKFAGETAAAVLAKYAPAPALQVAA